MLKVAFEVVAGASVVAASIFHYQALEHIDPKKIEHLDSKERRLARQFPLRSYLTSRGAVYVHLRNICLIAFAASIIVLWIVTGEI